MRCVCLCAVCVCALCVLCAVCVCVLCVSVCLCAVCVCVLCVCALCVLCVPCVLCALSSVRALCTFVCCVDVFSVCGVGVLCTELLASCVRAVCSVELQHRACTRAWPEQPSSVLFPRMLPHPGPDPAGRQWSGGVPRRVGGSFGPKEASYGLGTPWGRSHPCPPEIGRSGQDSPPAFLAAPSGAAGASSEGGGATPTLCRESQFLGPPSGSQGLVSTGPSTASPPLEGGGRCENPLGAGQHSPRIPRSLVKGGEPGTPLRLQ